MNISFRSINNSKASKLDNQWISQYDLVALIRQDYFVR